MGMPARRIELPPGFPLSNDQVVTLLDSAAARVVRGEAFDVATDARQAYTVQVAVGCVLDKEEIIVALTRLDQAKRNGHADATFTYADGVMLKMGLMLMKHPGAGIDPLTLTSGGATIREF